MRPQASHALLAKQKSNDQKMLYHFSLKHVPYITRRLLQVALHRDLQTTGNPSIAVHRNLHRTIGKEFFSCTLKRGSERK